MPPALEPWGKLQRSPPGQLVPTPLCEAARLSLVAHCIDVAAVVKALLELPTWRARLEALAKRPLTAVDIDRLVALAFLHDVGKAGAGFYSKGTSDAVAQAWRARTRADRVAFGHVAVVGPLFSGDRTCAPLRDALGVDDVLAWGGEDDDERLAVQTLWLASISHHGTPLTLGELKSTAGLASWTVPIDGYQPVQGLARLAAVVRDILPQAFVLDAPALRANAALTHAFAGLVSLADWIGSNTDPAFFPYDLGGQGGIEVQDERRWPIAQKRARDVLVAMRLNVEDVRADLRRRSPSFLDVFGSPPRAMQALAGRTDLGPLVVIEAETGSGKTEAALWRFKALFEAGEVDSLCFLLPTRVSATAIAKRVQNFVEALFPDPKLRPSTVLAVPGYLRANGHEAEAKALPNFKVLWPDPDPQQRPLYWAAEHSKRYFAAGCATGTIDQLLLSVLQTKHAHLRGTVLLRALVVVDEVHASDPYMTALLHAALERQVRAGGRALLMSATLTGEARARLVQAGVPVREAARRRDALAVADAPYPCVSDSRQLLGCEPAMPARRVRCQLLAAMRDPVAVAEIVATAIADGARVLVLRNTVAQAVATQQAIEARLGSDHPALFRVGGVGGVVAMHHGRYAFEDRRALDLEVEAAFGAKAATSRAARVLVGTQTLEISLDCDADLMLTDIVPMDVLLQRLGRLHRHRERDDFRPASCTSPRVIVLTPPSRDLALLLKPGATRGLGLGPRSAYENLLAIEATLRVLEDTATYSELVIPDHNRALVEAGVDAGRLHALAENLGGDWPEAFVQVIGKYSAQRAQAGHVQVKWDRDWNDEPWSDLSDEARTRLGLDGIDIELLQPWTSPLGQRLTTFSVPPWLLPGIAGATEAPLVSAQHDDGDSLRLDVAGHNLRYDRLGLRAG